MLQILEMPQRGRRFRRKIIKYCFRKRRSMTFPKRSQGSERITGKSNNHILEGYHQNQVSEAIRTLESSITTYHQARLSTKKAPGLDCPSGPQMKVSGVIRHGVRQTRPAGNPAGRSRSRRGQRDGHRRDRDGECAKLSVRHRRSRSGACHREETVTQARLRKQTQAVCDPEAVTAPGRAAAATGETRAVTL